MNTKKKVGNTILVVIMTILSLLWIYPVFMILINSLKKESAISTGSVFKLPTAETFAGLENYINAIESKGFLNSLGYSLFITITSVAAILLFCSMCAWYITRVKGILSKVLYFLFVFSMVVPFQLVMFTLSPVSYTHLDVYKRQGGSNRNYGSTGKNLCVLVSRRFYVIPGAGSCSG